PTSGGSGGSGQNNHWQRRDCKHTHLRPAWSSQHKQDDRREIMAPCPKGTVCVGGRVYMSVCVCTYTIFICILMCVCVCVCPCMYLYAFVCMCVCVCFFPCMCGSVCMLVYMYQTALPGVWLLSGCAGAPCC